MSGANAVGGGQKSQCVTIMSGHDHHLDYLIYRKTQYTDIVVNDMQKLTLGHFD